MPAKPKRQMKLPEEKLDTAQNRPEEQHVLVNQAIEKAEKLAEIQVEMARLFLARGKPDIARHRLTDVIENFRQSDAAQDARKLLRQL